MICELWVLVFISKFLLDLGPGWQWGRFFECRDRSYLSLKCWYFVHHGIFCIDLNFLKVHLTTIYLTKFVWHLLKFWARGTSLASHQSWHCPQRTLGGFVVKSDGLGEWHVDQHDGEGEILSLSPAFGNSHSLLRKCSGEQLLSLFLHVLLSPPPKGTRLTKLIRERERAPIANVS